MIKRLILGLIFLILVVGVANALSWSTIPGQTHQHGNSTNKIIDLSTYASSDATSYSQSCASGIVASVTGSSFAFRPDTQNTYSGTIQGFFGTAVCNVTAINQTSSLQTSFNIVVSPPAISLSIPGQVTLGAASNQQRNQNVTSSFTVSNTGSFAVNNIAVSTTALSQYGVLFSTTQNGTYASTSTFSLSTSASQTVYVKGYIPSTAPSGTNVDIGDISIQSTDLISSYTISGFYINPSSKLEISDINIIIDNDVSEDVSEFESMDDIKPGDTLEIEVEIKNLFTDAENLDLEDVRYEITIVDLDDGKDVDDRSDRFDVKASEEDMESVILTVPRDVKRGGYDVIIEAEARDENGSKHTDKFEFEIVVERRPHEIEIYEAALTRNKITTCSADRHTSISVLLENIGRDKENNVKIEAIHSNLKLNYVKSGIVLSDDLGKPSAQYSTTIPFTIPENLKTGIYTIPIKVYFNDVTSDLKELELEVEECPIKSAGPNDNSKSTSGTGSQNVDAQQTKTSGTGTSSTGSKPIAVATFEKTKFTESNWYVAILIILLVACLGAGAFIVMKFLLPRKN